MSITQATPYLFFSGTAEAAVQLYTRALGAEAEELTRYADMPADAGTCAPEDERRVMHATLRIGAARLMLSDVTHDRPASKTSNVEICLEFDDDQDMARRFDALAVGGTVVMKIHDAFWGGKFGALVDEFGIHWLFTSNAAGG